MAKKQPDINANYLQIRNIEIVCGDTFGLSIRLTVNGSPNMLTENGRVTFAIFDSDSSPVLSTAYDSTDQDEQGYINVYLTPDQTSLLRRSDRYTYELEWYINSTTIYTLLKGSIILIVDKITDETRGGE